VPCELVALPKKTIFKNYVETVGSSFMKVFKKSFKMATKSRYKSAQIDFAADLPNSWQQNYQFMAELKKSRSSFAYLLSVGERGHSFLATGFHNRVASS